MDFKTQLIEERKKQKMSLAKLGKLSGVPGSTISYYEQGGGPPLEKADKLLKALGVSIVLGQETPK